MRGNRLHRVLTRATLVALGAVIGTLSPALAANDPPPSRITIPANMAVRVFQQEPTRFLDTDTAQVLADEHAYWSAHFINPTVGMGMVGSRFGLENVGGFSYARGMGGRAELNFGLNAGFPFSGAFGGIVSGAWKQYLWGTSGLALALRPNAVLTFTPALSIGCGIGIPFTLNAGSGSLTLEPRVRLADVTQPTAEMADIAVGYQAPFGPHWTLLAQLTPSYISGTSGFSLPLGAGVRYSPTTTTHVDFQLLNMTATPSVMGGAGLVAMSAHLGI